MVTYVIYIIISVERIQGQSNGQPPIKISPINCDNPKNKAICWQLDITLPDMSE